MEKDVAIGVKNISKTFRIPHEKVSSLRGAAVNVFKKNSYEEFKALDDVSFEVKKGEFFGIIGRNGSGKSTLLKILAGIYQADKGKVRVSGLISPFLELGIGFNPELSGRDNVYLNATVLGLTKKEIDEKFDSIVKFSELERFIDQKLKNYSSGMQVRLAFSVSIHANRDILLMDEVLAVGDSNFQIKCLEEFNKYRGMGRTVIIVTHDIEVIRRYCDRALLLRNGKISRIGLADEVGNEYIYENMFDKQSASSKKNEKDKLSVKREFIPVEILDTVLMDMDGNMKNVFQTGDSFKFNINFKKNKNVEKINMGVGLYASNGVYIFGYNTQMDRYDIKHTDNDNLVLILKSIPLLNGTYYFRVVCFGNEENDYYDFKDKAVNFQVYSLVECSKYRGLVNINHKWHV